MAFPIRNAAFPAGGVMAGGVTGGVTPPASAGDAVIPANNARASAAMQALIALDNPKSRFSCNLLQFMFILLIDV